jgi:hypothetical protein
MNGKNVVLAVAVALVCVVVGTFGYIKFYSEAAPRYQAAQRQVFRQSQSYVDGKIQMLNKVRGEYETTTDESSRAALRQVIIREASTVDMNLLPLDLQVFVQNIKEGR